MSFGFLASLHSNSLEEGFFMVQLTDLTAQIVWSLMNHSLLGLDLNYNRHLIRLACTGHRQITGTLLPCQKKKE